MLLLSQKFFVLSKPFDCTVYAKFKEISFSMQGGSTQNDIAKLKLTFALPF